MTVAVVLGVAVAIAALLVVAPAMMSVRSEPLDTERQERWLVRRAPASWRRALLYVDRRVAGGILTASAFAVLFLGALLVGWVFDTIDENRGIARWDEAAAEWGAAHATTTSTRILDAITQFGATGWLLGVMAVVGISAALRRRHLGTLGYLAIVGLGVSLVNNLLKWTVDRERPDIAQLTGHGGSSFPSGHSAAAAACWAALALVLVRHRRRPVRLVGSVLAAVIAMAVAVSRVLLGVHWVTDVVAGVVVGWAWFFLTTLVFGGRLLRFGEPVERVAEAESAGDHAVDHDIQRDIERDIQRDIERDIERGSDGPGDERSPAATAPHRGATRRATTARAATHPGTAHRGTTHPDRERA